MNNKNLNKKQMDNIKEKRTIRKFGNWKIEIFENKIIITNGWYCDGPIFYNTEEFAIDNPYIIPNFIINYLKKNSKKLYNIQEEIFDILQ